MSGENGGAHRAHIRRRHTTGEVPACDLDNELDTREGATPKSAKNLELLNSLFLGLQRSVLFVSEPHNRIQSNATLPAACWPALAPRTQRDVAAREGRDRDRRAPQARVSNVDQARRRCPPVRKRRALVVWCCQQLPATAAGARGPGLAGVRENERWRHAHSYSYSHPRACNDRRPSDYQDHRWEQPDIVKAKESGEKTKWREGRAPVCATTIDDMGR